MENALAAGLCSITFRQFPPMAIVDLCRGAGLAGIEWGADVHAPPGEVRIAATVRDLTETAGLTVASYGSYYRAGTAPPDFGPVLESAVALGAPLIRVWAGNLGTADADADYRAAVIADLQRCADRADEHGITVALEYHAGTLTDNADSTLDLLRSADRRNLKTLWQPRNGVAVEDCLADLRRLTPHLANVHVFHWWPTANDRQPLADGTDRWRRYLAEVPRDGQRFALLEFVRDDDPAQLQADADALRRWLA